MTRKQITTKDVLYALEYLSERLVLRPDGKWRLEPSGQIVPDRAADEAKAHGGIVAYPDRSGLAVYGWRAAA
jgi:hypothetical protein